MKIFDIPAQVVSDGSFLLLVLGVRVENDGVPGLPQPNTEPHHRIGPAGRLAALRLLCDRRKVAGTGHMISSFMTLQVSFCDYIISPKYYLLLKFFHCKTTPCKLNTSQTLSRNNLKYLK